MLSVKRLFYVILLVLIVSGVFMTYNINEERSKHILIERNAVEEEPLLEEMEIKDRIDTTFYVIGDEKNDVYKDIYRNAVTILRDLKLPAEAVSRVSDDILADGAVLIFCGEDVSSRVDLISLGNFISKGGRVIFAAGLAEGDADSYLYPYMGITEKAVKENCQTLQFEKPFLPLQLDTVSYDQYNASTRIFLRSDAEVYISEKEKNIPLLYSYPFEEGAAVVINGTFLTDIRCCGLLTGAIGAVLEDFIYPVMGTKTVYLDNFPMVTYVDDKLCMKFYGRTTESFVRDVIWPKFQGISLRTDTKYTSGVLAEASEADAFPGINDSLFTTIGKSALQYGGELVYAANCKNPDEIYYNEAFIGEFQSVFRNYEINGLTLMSENFSEKMLDLPSGRIRAVRGYLGTDLSFQYNPGYFILPGATFGNDMEGGNLFALSSVLGTYGMVSHAFDINELVIGDDSEATWDLRKQQISKFESEVLEKVSYLEPLTLSEARNKVRSYVQLDYGWKKEGSKIRITCSNIVKGQNFFYKTGGTIKEARGLTYTEAGNGYYLLEMNENQAEITLEER